MKKKIIILVCILLILCVCIVLFIIKNKNNTSEYQESWPVWSESETVNKPILSKGMQAIIFEEEKETSIIIEQDKMKEGEWYNYIAQESTTENGGTSNWANAMTSDGSMWVWIPRFAYKIEWDEEQELTGKIDVIFLEGTSNKNKEGIDVTTLGYTVHPAFQNGESNNYNNGEWDKEITGFWISKFEAGYAGQKNTASEDVEIVNTNIQYERDAQNILGEIKSKETYITYPVFMGKTYSYNNIEIGEMYDLSQALNKEGNPYGFDETVDSHLIKNSEWGAVAYLAHSQYGRNGTKVTINNMNVSQAVYAAETVTGYAGDTVASSANKLEKIDTKLQDSYNDKSYAWYTKQGKLASTTGNLYGVYDMNGACSEYTAGYIEDIDEEKGMRYAKSMVENKTSTKYYTVYKSGADNDLNTITVNYEVNKNIHGDAIEETSKKATGYTSWFGETSMYIKESDAFFLRSGAYDRLSYSGLFDYTNHSGHSYGSYGFHCALINE